MKIIVDDDDDDYNLDDEDDNNLLHAGEAGPKVKPGGEHKFHISWAQSCLCCS